MMNRKIVADICKIAENLLLTGETGCIEGTLQKIGSQFSFGSVRHVLGTFKYYRLNFTQTKEPTLLVDIDEKLTVLKTNQFFWPRRRIHLSALSEPKCNPFVPVYFSIGWLGIS